MKSARSLLISAMLALPAVVWAGPLIDDPLSSLNWSIWCPCQINMAKAPIAFTQDPELTGNHFARIAANDASLGGNKCRPKAPDFECRPPVGSSEFTLYGFDKKAGAESEFPPDLPEPLGPSLLPHLKAVQQGLLESLRRVAVASNAHCTPEIERRARNAGEDGLCIQRQELRAQRAYAHAAGVAHLYSFRFRMPRDIQDQSSNLRWVTAQWKDEPVSKNYNDEFGNDWGASPFLAQRFDDGVLHVTVQDEHCRCVVASAPLPDGSTTLWRNGRAEHCRSTKPGASEGGFCTPELWVQYGPAPVLTSPRGRWIEMRYRVQAGRTGGARIEVYEGSRFIVRITGRIGYAPRGDQISITKFKIGHYRDYMPFEHAMDVDWVRVESVADQ
jgi:hypothetical protein